MNEISDVDAAWVAGLLEGEGSFFIRERGTRRKLARVSMGSCDLDVLERLHAIVGAGKILRFKDRPRRKPHWSWTIQQSREAVALMERVHPFMGERRSAKITEVLANVDDLDVAPCDAGHDVTDPANVFYRRGYALCRPCYTARLHHQPSLARLDTNTGADQVTLCSGVTSHKAC